jgi:hypothetical protein
VTNQQQPGGEKSRSLGAILSKVFGLVAGAVKWTAPRLVASTKSAARGIRSVAGTARQRWKARRQSGEE